MTETAVDRIRYKKFWSSFSNVCDNTAMMLNSSADDFEEEEREYILSCLPDLHGKDVVDIGAGIGRFTTMFARAARHVLSCDFMASFMRKNQERNEHFSNITYQVIDAVHLKLKPNSVDLVFTNWLLMYLNDEEVIEFLLNVLESIRPNGFLHLRESCSQPSTAHANSTMHTTTETNPTSYRHVSEYIRLLKSVRCRQSDGKVYRFEVHWACSVPTYIMVRNQKFDFM
ncbi:unnamed protein product [Anisakis simplex]|uniref:phosphoethanolamine N-methyltransferase n=1 Tax=Anisakis simplex TaxID=6269 RepID=A0A0M3J0B4_ANISI|nr:unnamed protein product [Anisakis simplex]